MSEITRLFDEFFAPARFNGPVFSHVQRFPMDVMKTDTGYEVIAELPGVNESDTSVEVTRDALVIKVQKTHSEKNENTSENSSYVVRERRSISSHERKLALPKDVDVDKVEATFENGLLTIALPVKEAEKPRAIKVGVKAKEIES